MTDAQRIAQLEEQVAWLRSELGDMLDATALHDLCRTFRLEPMQARLVLRLHLARGRVVRCDALLDHLQEETSRNTLSVHIWRARQRLGSAAIVTAAGGYRLSARTLTQLDAILTPQPRLVAAQ